MSVIFVLLPIASLLAVFFVIAFIWAVRRGQFDDLTTPAVRILHDDDDVADNVADNVTSDTTDDQTENNDAESKRSR